VLVVRLLGLAKRCELGHQNIEHIVHLMNLDLEVEEGVLEKVKLVGGVLLADLLVVSLVFLVLFFKLFVLLPLHHTFELIPMPTAKLANDELR
jgi:hypothetical protein